MAGPQSAARRLRHASLGWPLLLTVPPIVLLAVVAIVSLREDRTAIERDARRDAALLSEQLARRWAPRASAELASLVASGCSSTHEEVRASTGSARTDNGARSNAPESYRNVRPEPFDSPVTVRPELVEGRTHPLAQDGLVEGRTHPLAQDKPEARTPICALVIDGRIRVPLDYSPVPSPPALMTPPAARASAEWSALRTELNANRGVDATARLVDFARRAAGIVTESGVPLSDLALLLALKRAPTGRLPPVLLAELGQRIVESPSLMTASLVEEAQRVAPGDRPVAAVAARWEANERALALLRRVPLDSPRPAAIWLDADQGAWLALIHPLAASDAASPDERRRAFQVTLLPAPALERAFGAASVAGEIPRYAVAAVRVGGRTFRTDGASRPATPGTELAAGGAQIDVQPVVPADTASTFTGELLRAADEAVPARQQTPGMVRLAGVPGGHRFEVVLQLTDPGLLYSSYRARVRLLIALIVVATAAALGGLAGAWRAFERQRRLADMKANFVASVSHELRAPIAAVRLMTESLERDAVEPAARRQEYLRVIGQECRRLSSLVENVLDFSRIDRGRRQYAFEATDLPGVVTQAIEVMRPYAAQRNVTLLGAPVPAAAPPITANADRQALQQALVNLLDNAIKHSPAGAEVIAGLEVAPSVVRLFVEDHGPGIPEDDHERIFEPFYRRGSELRRETQGIGIGLSIVKHVAEAHGGRVVVRSSPGNGSRFAIELPVAGP